MVGVKNFGFILKKFYNVMMEEVGGYVGINSCERIIEEVYFFVLN